MRILFILNGFFRGGAEMQIWQLGNALLERNVLCRIVALAEVSNPVIPDWNRVPISSIGGNQLYDGSAIRRLARLVEESQPNLIVTVNQRPLFYAQIAKFFASSKAKVVCIFQTTREHLDHKLHHAHLAATAASHRRAHLKSVKDWLLSALYRPFFAATDALVYVSGKQQAAWEKVGYTSRRPMVIYNGVDTQQFAPDPLSPLRESKRSELGFAADDFVVGLSAEFRPEKNHVQLVDAVKALRQRGIPAKALFVGDGPTAPDVARYAAAMGVGEHAVFAGHQSDVRPFLAAFDAGVLCSTAETFSLAALEILATGTPVVATDTGGGAEMIVHGESGFLFPVGDTEALVRHLEALAEPAQRARMGSTAALDMRQRFDLSVMVETYAELFQKLTVQANVGSVRKVAYPQAQ